MDGARRFWGAVTSDATCKREILEERAHPFDVLALTGVNLRIRTLQIDWPENSRGTVTGAGQKNGIEIVLLYKAIEVNIREAQTGARSPVAQQSKLDMLWLERFTKQGIVTQINHAGGEVIARTPVRVDFAQLLGR